MRPDQAYVTTNNGRWWIVAGTPSGLNVRLLISYDSRVLAEQAMKTFGYRTMVAVPDGSNDA